MYVISLSTIPSRFALFRPTLESLLSQHRRAERVIVYLPRRYRRFPDYDGTLPEVPKGVELRVVQEDIGPATKVLFAAEEFRGSGLGILYCDDDRLYHPGWAEELLNGWDSHPEAAIAAVGFDLAKLGLASGTRLPRARRRGNAGRDLPYHLQRLRQRLAAFPRSPRGLKPPRRLMLGSGYSDIAEGFGGVLVRPEFFDLSDRDIPPVLWAVDDIWLSGQLERRGIPIWVESGVRLQTDASQHESALYASVIDGANREQANRLCAGYMRDTYGIWGGRLPAGAGEPAAVS